MFRRICFVIKIWFVWWKCKCLGWDGEVYFVRLGSENYFNGVVKEISFISFFKCSVILINVVCRGWF